MAIDFPSSPSNGQTVVVGGITYTFNSSKGVWADTATGLPVTISDTPPSNPAAGNIWYDSSDPALYIYYNDGSSAQWVSANPNNRTTNNAIALTDFSVTSATPSGNGALSYNNSTGVFNFTPADTESSSGVTTYSALSDLPMSGQNNGALAFVSGTNRLYIWNNSGWYNIALVNTNPSISGASATYDLSAEGANTVVTLVATDPEGLPITFTATHSGIGVGANAIATVTQSNNIFTYTPTTNTSLAGTFTTTFTASDGVNIAGANSSFTLSFNVIVANSKYTTALITSVGGNNADNNDFVDSSTNSHTVTGYNGAQNTTFSPYRKGGYSVYFDGSSDNLGFASLSALNVNTYMSLECWIKLEGTGSYLIVGRDAGYWLMYNQSGLGGASNKFSFGAYAGGSWQAVSSTTTPDVGVWYHIVGVREGSSFKIYVNGSLENTATISGSPASGGVVGVGANSNGIGGSVKGYLADVRVVISSSQSSLPYTSNFDVPTTRLTAVTDTQLLTCHDRRFIEGSTHNHTLTPNGNVEISAHGPLDTLQYTASDHSSSMRFDQTSSNDYVLVANDNSAMDLGSAFTLECWFWTENRNTDVAIMQRGGGGGSAWSGTDGIYYGISFTNSKIAWISQPSGGSNQYMTGTTNVPLNQWNHVAVSYNGTTTSVYLNGVREATSTQTYNTPSSRGVFAVGTGTVGGAASSTNDYTGNIAEFRLSNSVRYDPSQTTLTMPTAPFTSDSDTGVLLKGGNAGIIDKSQSAKTLTLNGDVKSSTTQTKYLSSSMYFDGTGDYIVAECLELGSGNFTVEFWMRGSDVNPGSNFRIIEQSGGDFAVDIGGNGKIRAHRNGGNFKTAEGVLTQDTWHHVAVVREGTGNNEAKIYIDGTLEATGTLGDNYAASNFEIGGNSTYYTGYLSDLRITKGLARYTSAFTPPSAALDG